MTAHKLPFHGPSPEPREADMGELARLRERFPMHDIFHRITQEGGVRYIAQGAAVGVRPHTIITHDLAELRDELEQAAHQELSVTRSTFGRVA